MYPNQTLNVPVGQTGYVPYFYESGRFLAYPLPSQNAPRQASYQASSSYDFSSDIHGGRPFERIQTVEQVIAHGYFAVPGGDPVTAIISDKKHTSRLGLDDVIGQIRSRYTIYERNMYELDQAVCEASNSLFRQMADHGLTVANQRQQYSASKMKQQLYEQQRAERQNLWRDVSRLRLALPENAQQYLTAYRKVSALESYRGDAP